MVCDGMGGAAAGGVAAHLASEVIALDLVKTASAIDPAGTKRGQSRGRDRWLWTVASEFHGRTGPRFQAIASTPGGGSIRMVGWGRQIEAVGEAEAPLGAGKAGESAWPGRCCAPRLSLGT
jgi:hypothetical protein